MANIGGKNTPMQNAKAKMAPGNLEIISDGTVEGTEVWLIADDGTRHAVKNVIRCEIYLSADTRSAAVRVMNVRTKVIMPAPTTKMISVEPHPDSPLPQGRPLGGPDHNI